MATDRGVLNLLYSDTTTALDFHYDSLIAPPLYSLLTFQDIEELRKIATSVRLSGDVDKKYKMIDNIMKMRGFKKLAAGTNRVVYYHPDIPSIVLKIAMDAVGMGDNPAEFYNQRFIKPFCCKVFEISRCGTVGVFERVDRITSRYEFASIAEDVFWVITSILVGKYVLNDIGAKFMYNWGVRRGFGPVILDFPYLYELDGAKLICTQQMEDGSICNGDIDYDVQFNFLVCKKCGKVYSATELAKPHKESGILVREKGGSTNMKVELRRGTETVKGTDKKDAYQIMKKPTEVKKDNNGKIKGRVVGDKIVTSEKDIVKEATFYMKRGNKITEPTNKKEETVKDLSSGKFSLTRKTKADLESEKSKKEIDAFAAVSGAVVVGKEEEKKEFTPTLVRGSSANTEEYLKKAEEVVKNDPTALVAVHDVEMINRVAARTLNSRILKEEELENIINIGLSVFDGDCITVNITDHETDVIDTVFDALDKDKHAMALAHAYNKYSDKADECECESDMSKDQAEAFSVERLKKQFANLLDSCPNDQKLDFLNRFIEDSGADEKYKVFDTSTFRVIANPNPDVWPPIMAGKSYADDDTDPLAPAIESAEESSNESYTDSEPINSMADILKNIDMDAFPPMNAVSFEGEEPSEEKQENKYEYYSNDPMPEKDPLLESIAMARRNRLGE